MHAIALDDAQLLDTWDRALALDRPWRELMLLAHASGIALDELAHLSIGERDRLLLRLRVGTFGRRMEGETRCPACGARLELSLDADDVCLPPRAIDPADLQVTEEEWTVRFRLPDSADIAACRHPSTDADDVLVRRCVIVESSDTHAAADAPLPQRVREAVVERMAALDAQADVLLDVTCPECAHEWRASFDPAAFLLQEVEAYAARLTAEVHQLARAYGWSEASILTMGPARRRRYLALLLQ